MKKISFILLTAILLATNINAQGSYEWARGFENTDIIGSVVDRNGNLYVLGDFKNNSRWGNERLMDPQVIQMATNGILIAKISPQGDLEWKKMICGTIPMMSFPFDIKLVGDSAVFFLAEIPLAPPVYSLYYLDTLIPATNDINHWPDYPLNASELLCNNCLALVGLDFDGNVIEQNFLHISYLDSLGADLPHSSIKTINNALEIREPSFAIDKDGYIYLSRLTYDREDLEPLTGAFLEDGAIRAIKVWCNLREVGVIPYNRDIPICPQILKFSPHFDTLIGSRLIFQKQPKSLLTGHMSPHLGIDPSGGGPCIWGTIKCGVVDMSMEYEDAFVIDSAKGISYSKGIYFYYKEFFVKLDSALDVKHCIAFDDSIVSSTPVISSSYIFDVGFDTVNDLMVIAAGGYRRTYGGEIPVYSILMYQGVPVDTIGTDVFIMVLKNDSNSATLLSSGYVPATTYSDMYTDPFSRTRNILACNNNRIFIQARVDGGIHFPDTSYEWEDWYYTNLCLIEFDYYGNVIGGDCYHTFSPDNRPGPVAVHGSDLYLCNKLCSEAMFGDIYVPGHNNPFASIVKYTDKDFLDPYPYDPVGGIAEADQAGKLSVFPNPTIGRVVVALSPYEPITEAYAVTLTGIRHRVPVNGNSIDLADFPSGILFLQLVTPRHIYTQKVVKTR